MAGNEYREIIERLDRIETHLTAPDRGIFVRMKQVEDRQALFMWIVGAVFVAVLAVAVPSAWSFVDRMNRFEQQHQAAIPAGKP